MFIAPGSPASRPPLPQPVLIRERAVFYRERASRMYIPEAYAASFFLTELPWLALLVLVVIPPVYFMVGFNPNAGVFFSYLVTVYVLCVLFISLGEVASAFFSTIDVAQAAVGVVIPL
jgi:ABC-type multidrug transport system permease subunit